MCAFPIRRSLLVPSVTRRQQHEHAPGKCVRHVTQITVYSICRPEKRKEINIKHIVRTYLENGFQFFGVPEERGLKPPADQLISIQFIFICFRPCLGIICGKFSKCTPTIVLDLRARARYSTYSRLFTGGSDLTCFVHPAATVLVSRIYKFCIGFESSHLNARSPHLNGCYNIFGVRATSHEWCVCVCVKLGCDNFLLRARCHAWNKNKLLASAKYAHKMALRKTTCS